MGRTLGQKIGTLSSTRQSKIESRAKELIAEEATLQELRKAIGLPQTRVAEELSVGQDTVSRIEKRTDMLLSTLSGYVEALGGKLNLVAEFPDRPPVNLNMLEHVATMKRNKGASRKVAASAGTRRRRAADSGETSRRA